MDILLAPNSISFYQKNSVQLTCCAQVRLETPCNASSFHAVNFTRSHKCLLPSFKILQHELYVRHLGVHMYSCAAQ